MENVHLSLVKWTDWMHTPSKNSMSSFSAGTKKDATRLHFKLLWRGHLCKTRAAHGPWQCDAPPHQVQQGWRGQEQQDCSQSWHWRLPFSPQVLLHTLIWMNWFLAGLDADNGGRGQRRVLTRNRLRRRYPKHCQVKSTEYNYNRLGLLLQKIDSFSRCCISFQIPPSTVHNVPELFKGFWGDLESIIDHGNPSNHCSFHKYSREERKKEGEDWGGKSEGGSQADGPSDPLHNKLNRRIVYILTLRSTGTWSWSKDRVSFHSSKSTSSSKYSWSKKSSASSSQCSLSTLRWLSMSSSLIPPNPNSGCHSLSSAI